MKPFRIATVAAAFVLALTSIEEPAVEAQSGVPSVSGVSGSLTHGSTVTVTGVRFGTKPMAAPIKYDDFQAVPMGQNIESSPAPGPPWINAGGIGSNNYHPIASSTRLRPGTPFSRNMQSHWSQPSGGGNSSSTVALLNQPFVKFYLDAWMYNDLGAVTSNPLNVKHLRLHALSAGAPNVYVSNAGPYGSGIACGRDGVSYSDSAWLQNFEAASFYGQWLHLQWLIDAGTGNGNANGKCILYINGNLEYNHTNVTMLPPGHTSWPEIYIGNYVRTGDWSGNMYAYWESVYVDNSWARVEIGNHSNYASSTHREIQLPTSWTDTAVSIRLNRGSFASLDSLYLFVVDAAGNTSPGFRVSGGSGGSVAPPNVPTNLRILRE